MKNVPPELTTITPTSKYLSLILFIILPIIGFYIGWQYGATTAMFQQNITVTQPPPPPEQSGPFAPIPDYPTENTTPGSLDSDEVEEMPPYPGEEDPLIPDFPPIQTNDTCNVTNCHGMEVMCGEIPSNSLACTMEYRLGDFCRQYVTCGVVDNTCQPIKDSRYETCVSCVQQCLNEEDPLKSFECEERCRAIL